MSDGPTYSEALSAGRHIIVPQSAFDAWPQSPDVLVQAVVDYVTYMMRRGRYTRHELCEAAVRAFHCDQYLTQVRKGGHVQFVANTRSLLDVMLADVLFGLKDMGAREHLILARRMSQWVLDNEDALDTDGWFTDGSADPLAELDIPFVALDDARPMTFYSAEWLAQHPGMRVVPDADMPAILHEIAQANPALAHRDTTMQVARLHGMVTQNPEAQFAVLAGAQKKPQPLVSVGTGTWLDINGQERMVFDLTTIAGNRWCVLTDEGASLHEQVEPEVYDDEMNGHAPQLHASHIGAQIAFASKKQIAACAAMADKLNVGAAVHLLLQDLPDPAEVDYITIRSAGPDQNGLMGMSLLLVLNEATVAMSAIVTTDHAVLLAEPSHAVLKTVSKQQINDHAKTFSLETL